MPFYPQFRKLMSRLQNAGIIIYWIDDVIANYVRENREVKAVDLKTDLEAAFLVSSVISVSSSSCV